MHILLLILRFQAKTDKEESKCPSLGTGRTGIKAARVRQGVKHYLRTEEQALKRRQRVSEVLSYCDDERQLCKLTEKSVITP